jgi:AcrR family transcriptional regulator
MTYVPAEQRRREFVEAAARVIAERGVAGATTRRIAEAAGAPAANLHYAFRNKEEIFYELFKQQAERIVEKVRYGNAGDGLGATATRLLEEIVSWYLSEPDYSRAQMELLMWSIKQPQYADMAVRAYEIHAKNYSEVLRHGMAAGDDESLVEPFAYQIALASDGLALQWFTYQDDDRLRSAMELAAETLSALADKRRVIATI